MNLDRSALLQKRIQLFAIAGILLTGLLVGLSTAVPLYRHAYEIAATALQDTARSQSRSAAQYLASNLEVARQIASRSVVRDSLEAYNRGEIDLDALTRASSKRWNRQAPFPASSALPWMAKRCSPCSSPNQPPQQCWPAT